MKARLVEMPAGKADLFASTKENPSIDFGF
jgi:hypothetical protein